MTNEWAPVEGSRDAQQGVAHAACPAGHEALCYSDADSGFGTAQQSVPGTQ